MNNTFNEDDKKKVVDFLNFIAKNAEFKMNTNDAIMYYKMLNYMQQVLLPKIDDNILEVVAVHEKEE